MISRVLDGAVSVRAASPLRPSRIAAGLLLLATLFWGFDALAQDAGGSDGKPTKAAGNGAGLAGGGGAGGGAASPVPTGGSALLALPLQAQPSHLDSAFELKPVDAVRGGVVSVNVAGTRLPKDPAATTIWLDDLLVGRPTNVDDDGKAFSFLVPSYGAVQGKANMQRMIHAGHYTLHVAFVSAAGTPAATPELVSLGVLRITPEKAPPLVLEAVTPTIIYPDRKTLVLTGSGLGGDLRDYSLMVDGIELPLCDTRPNAPVASPRDPAMAHQEQGCKLDVSFDSDHQLEIPYESLKAALDGDFTGDHELALRAGDTTTTNSIKVACSGYTVGTIRASSLGITLLLLAGIVLLTVYGGGRRKIGKRNFIANTFLFESETDTYSLGKVQAYLWLLAALLAYLYLALSHSLVQGRLDIIDLPENLLNILALSLGTTVVSVGVTKVRGPKASGGVYPSFGDLISTGGVVSPERVAFLVWTLVAVALFILNVWQVDPMVLDALPKVPDGLLALSGLTAATYLGGKAVRGAGPVIDEVLASGAAPGITLVVTGRHLSLDATFEVEGESIAPLLDAAKHPDRRPAVITAEEHGDEKFAKSLKLELTALPPRWSELLADPRRSPPVVAELTIANADGQRASGSVMLRA